MLTYPVITTDGPENHQGVYRQNTIGLWPGGAGAFKILLDYVVQTWAKVYHQSYPHAEVAQLHNQQGERLWIATDEGFENWRISKIAFEIVSVPAGLDVVFGTAPLIYAGKCAFGQCLLDVDALDFTFDGGVQLGAGFTGGASINAPAQVTIGFQAYQLNTMLGPRFTDTPQPAGTQFQFVEQPSPTYATATFSFGRKQQFKIAAKTQRAQPGVNWRYPLRYINYDKSIFDADNPNCSSVWWHLKPGVVANVTVYGMQIEPHVSVSGFPGGGG